MSTKAQQIGELIKADPKRHATEHPLFVAYRVGEDLHRRRGGRLRMACCHPN